MRHKIAHRKLNRTSEHRKALFMNMLNSLIKYEQITTTLPKAKELKPQIDKVITIGKNNALNNKKKLYSKLQDKNSVKKVFSVLSERYNKRNGGYSRVLKAGFRTGDDAPMADRKSPRLPQPQTCALPSYHKSNFACSTTCF